MEGANVDPFTLTANPILCFTWSQIGVNVPDATTPADFQPGYVRPPPPTIGVVSITIDGGDPSIIEVTFDQPVVIAAISSDPEINGGQVLVGVELMSPTVVQYAYDSNVTAAENATWNANDPCIRTLGGLFVEAGVFELPFP